jgi:hypothetical protein
MMIQSAELERKIETNGWDAEGKRNEGRHRNREIGRD